MTSVSPREAITSAWVLLPMATASFTRSAGMIFARSGVTTAIGTVDAWIAQPAIAHGKCVSSGHPPLGLSPTLRDELERRLRARVGIRERDMIRIAGQHEKFRVRDLLLPRAVLLD